MEALWEPKIVGFLCNWCSYAGADLAGVSRFQYSTDIRIIKVMCSTRVDPIMIIKPLSCGIDGVLILGCHIGDCHYITGNLYTTRKVNATKIFIERVGLNPDRIYLDWVSAAEGERFATIINSYSERIRTLGKIGEKENIPQVELKKRLDAVIYALQEERIRWLIGKDYQLTENTNAFGEKIDQKNYIEMLKSVIASEYERSLIILALNNKTLTLKDIAFEVNMPLDKVLKHLIFLRSRNLIEIEKIVGNIPYFKLCLKSF